MVAPAPDVIDGRSPPLPAIQTADADEIARRAPVIKAADIKIN